MSIAWTESDFEAIYGVTLATVVFTYYTTLATTHVKQYITTAAYDDAIAVAPDDADAALIIKAVVGDLAYFYLAQIQSFGVSLAPVSSYSESYAGIKSYTETHGAGGSVSIRGTMLSEANILDRLIAYRRAIDSDDFNPVESWGSSRYIGVVEEEEDDE